MTVATAVALVLGFALGLVAHSSGSSFFVGLSRVIEPLGVIFVRLLKMVVIPLVVSTLFVGVAQVGDLRRLGRMSVLSLLFFLATTIIAVGLGMGLTGGLLAIAAPELSLQQETQNDPAPDFPGPIEFLLNLVPENPIQVAVEGSLLPLMIFTVLFAAAVGSLPEQDRARLLGLGRAVTAVLIKIVYGILWVAPIGVFALAAPVAARTGWSLVVNFGIFVSAVLIGLLILAAGLYLPIASLVGRVSPRLFVQACVRPQVIAAATASSVATIPAMLEAAGEELKLSDSVTSFVIPFSATINRAGSALFQGSAVVFLAWLYGVPFPISGVATAIIATTMVSFTVAGVPSASIMTLAPALGAVGVPLDGLALLFGVDRIPDMARTATNVTGHITVAIVADRLIVRDAPGESGR